MKTNVKAVVTVLVAIGCLAVVGCGPSITSKDPAERAQAIRTSTNSRALARTVLLDDLDPIRAAARQRLIEVERDKAGAYNSVGGWFSAKRIIEEVTSEINNKNDLIKIAITDNDPCDKLLDGINFEEIVSRLDQESLKQVALHAKSNVAVYAARKIKDNNTLLDIMQKTGSEKLHEEIIDRIDERDSQDRLIELFKHEKSAEVRSLIVSKINDEKFLFFIAQNRLESGGVRGSAAAKISDQSQLAVLAQDDHMLNAVIDKLTDQEVLKGIVQREASRARDWDRNKILYIAVGRISDQQFLDGLVLQFLKFIHDNRDVEVLSKSSGLRYMDKWDRNFYDTEAVYALLSLKNKDVLQQVINETRQGSMVYNAALNRLHTLNAPDQIKEMYTNLVIKAHGNTKESRKSIELLDDIDVLQEMARNNYDNPVGAWAKERIVIIKEQEGMNHVIFNE